MSCLLADHPDSATATYVDMFGQGYVYKPGAADDWANIETPEDYDDDDSNK